MKNQTAPIAKQATISILIVMSLIAVGTLVTSPGAYNFIQVCDLVIVFCGASAVLTPVFMHLILQSSRATLTNPDTHLATIMILLYIGVSVIFGIMRFM